MYLVIFDDISMQLISLFYSCHDLAGKIVHHSDLAVSAWGYGLGEFLAGHEIPGHIPSPLAIHWPLTLW